MKSYACPSCGAQITFRSNLTVYAVCPYCSTTVVRHDVDVEAIGKMAALPDDMSPFQIGTEGVYKKVHFGIIGRMKIGWEDGCWNEWFIISDDGRKGWLAEAQGFYAVCFESDEPLSRETETRLRAIKNPGPVIALREGKINIFARDRMFKVVDVKDATCIGSEGELPFRAPRGRKTISIDLIATEGSGGFASIELDGDKRRVFIGDYVGWDDLRCTNFRRYEGW